MIKNIIMKTLYIAMIIAIYSFAGWTTRGEIEEYNQNTSDSITLVGKNNVDKLKILYAKEKNNLSDNLDSLRNSDSNTIIKVVTSKPTILKAKPRIIYVPVPRYDTVILKYSLWSTRGAHVTIDTIIKKGKTK